MKQTFEEKGGALDGRRHLPLLRTVLEDMGLHGLYIPHEDEYQNEYLPACNERLAWATGCTGSAGAAVVLKDEAALFVDGRYTLQGRDQTDPDLFSCHDLMDPGPFGWLADQALDGMVIGFDPKLMTPGDVARLTEAVTTAGGKVKALGRNPIDKAWKGRPREPMAGILPHDLTFAGESSSDKRARLGETLKAQRADAAIITAPSSIAWLFNVRGGDVQYSPLPLGRAILNANGTADLFIDFRKETEDLRRHLGNEVTLRPLKELPGAIRELRGTAVSLDPKSASDWFFRAAKRAKAHVVEAMDPCALPKACKNAAEIGGTERAHERDAIAIVRFLHWLDTEAQSGDKTEIDGVLTLQAFREQSSALKDLSFDTISGAGPNGALPHYRVSSTSNRPLEKGTLYLVDSGGQYLDGTTDITRTVAIGEPTSEMRDRFTRVLKGHIALAEIRFPKGTTGTHLDAFARHSLWQAGLDYDHGTGHGVGAYLGVHEGPQRIAKAWNDTPLETGMIVSNEPGFYKEGAFGIRIENLQYVTEPALIEGGDRPMYGFRQITLAPISRDLVVKDLLTDAEIDWLNTYHARVWATLHTRFEGDDAVRDWLEAACQPI